MHSLFSSPSQNKTSQLNSTSKEQLRSRFNALEREKATLYGQWRDTGYSNSQLPILIKSLQEKQLSLFSERCRHVGVGEKRTLDLMVDNSMDEKPEAPSPRAVKAR